MMFWAAYCRQLQTLVPQSGYRHYVYTSNVDGHHRRSGVAEAALLEMHGCLNWWVHVPPAGPIEGPWSPPPSFRFKVDPKTLQIETSDSEVVTTTTCKLAGIALDLDKDQSCRECAPKMSHLKFPFKFPLIMFLSSSMF